MHVLANVRFFVPPAAKAANESSAWRRDPERQPKDTYNCPEGKATKHNRLHKTEPVLKSSNGPNECQRNIRGEKNKPSRKIAPAQNTRCAA